MNVQQQLFLNDRNACIYHALIFIRFKLFLALKKNLLCTVKEKKNENIQQETSAVGLEICEIESQPVLGI